MATRNQAGRAEQATHAQISGEAIALFHQRIPRRAYAMDQLGPMVLLPKPIAIKLRYIQPQPKGVIGLLPFDIDRELGALAWEDANLPPPNLAVINPENTHAHLLYMIEAPVFLGESNQTSKAAWLLRTIQRGMNFQLRADPGYSGFTCKNPLNESWPVWSPAPHAYELGELLEYLNPEALRYANAKIKPREEIGVGRNVSLFDQTRRWAYRWARVYKESATFAEWQAFVKEFATNRNAEFTYPLETPEVQHTAKSVAAWTWEKFSKAGFSKSQAAKAKRRAELARTTTQTQLKEIIQEKAGSGETPTAKAIAAEAGVHPRTVKRHEEALAANQDIYPDKANVHALIIESLAVPVAPDLRATGMTQQAIADTLGISQGRVSQILNEKEKQAGSPAAEEREQRILQLV